MAQEQYVNFGESTLNGAINNSVTSLTVISASTFPTSGDFRIVVSDTEVMIVTAVTGNVFTVTRGAEGTTAVSHLDGATVKQMLTRDGLKKLGSVIHVRDTHANIEALARLHGRLGMPSNGIAVDLDDGSERHLYGPNWPFKKVVDGSFSWVNQGGASIDTSFGGVLLEAPASASINVRARVKSIPAAPYTVTMAYVPHMLFLDAFYGGMALRESSSGKLILLSLQSNTGWHASQQVIQYHKWNSPTSFNADYTTTPSPIIAAPWYTGPCMWMRIKDDNTNRIVYISADGKRWHQMHSVGRTDFMTPDEIGFFLGVSNASFGSALHVLSWEETA